MCCTWDAHGNENEREVLIGWCTSMKVELFQIIPFLFVPSGNFVSVHPLKRYAIIITALNL